MNNILNSLPEMRSGNKLFSDLSVLPYYDENIRFQNQAVRLIALSDLYNIYIPSQMSTEIYSKLYLSLLRSLQNKASKNAVIQRNLNYKETQNKVYSGIMGGVDSWLISGCSGIGKSQAISRAIDLISTNGIIETQNPFTKIIPCLVVQCPFDSSVKGLLLEILRKVDEMLSSNYYIKSLKNRATTDMLIGTISQVAINHIGLLVVDEIQNVVSSKNGKNLVAMLTQLINSGGISICMVGTPECDLFFEQALHLARRSLGLRYGALEYNQYFFDLCTTLFKYQYTKEKTDITDSIIRWLYEHSGGIISAVVSLIHDSQEIAILNGKERIDIETLTDAYKKRLSMLHSYIEPAITRKSHTSTGMQVIDTYEKDNTGNKINSNLISALVSKAKTENLDIIALMSQNFVVEAVKI